MITIIPSFIDIEFVPTDMLTTLSVNNLRLLYEKFEKIIQKGYYTCTIFFVITQIWYFKYNINLIAYVLYQWEHGKLD